jgi:hypothetical protein
MADEVKPKRPVPPQFLKKKKELEEAKAVHLSDQLPPSPKEIIVENFAEKKEIDIRGLVRDLMFNRFFHISEKEARPIAERMAADGSTSLHGVTWFLAGFERAQLAKELKEKYGLSE